MVRDHRAVGEQHPRAWPGKPGKDQSGHQRHGEDAGEELDGCDEVAVMGLRMHVAVAGGRERLDAEIEVVDIGPVGHAGYRVIADPVKHCEHGVEGDEDEGGAGDKGRPGCGHAAMADVGPEAELQSLRDDLAAAEPDHSLPWRPLAWAPQY